MRDLDGDDDEDEDADDYGDKNEDDVLAMTASLRFESELNVDLNELQTNLVPFLRRTLC